jgi:hypothetical protein
VQERSDQRLPELSVPGASDMARIRDKNFQDGAMG